MRRGLERRFSVHAAQGSAFSVPPLHVAIGVSSIKESYHLGAKIPGPPHFPKPTCKDPGLCRSKGVLGAFPSFAQRVPAGSNGR